LTWLIGVKAQVEFFCQWNIKDSKWVETFNKGNKVGEISNNNSSNKVGEATKEEIRAGEEIKEETKVGEDNKAEIKEETKAGEDNKAEIKEAIKAGEDNKAEIKDGEDNKAETKVIKEDGTIIWGLTQIKVGEIIWGLIRTKGVTMVGTITAGDIIKFRFIIKIFQ
jgi:hypothetical protein